MRLELSGVRYILRHGRGAVSAARCYDFEAFDGLGGPPGHSVPFTLTCASDVVFLRVRPFTADSVLVLYFAGENPLAPQFCVAEFGTDDVTIRHVQDHHAAISKAIEDWEYRGPGVPTATPPGA